RLLFRSRVFLFVLSLSIIITLIYLVVWALDYYLIRPEDTSNGAMQHVQLSVISFIQMGAVSSVVLGSVVGLVVFKKWIADVQRMNELQQDNLKTELARLKSQVNPHFLFNTLNNLFVLTKTDPGKAGQVLLGLSDLLRYQLYDSAKEKILLSKDIDFIHNLLTLEKIRKNDFEFIIDRTGDIDGLMLPPFLFIPFVENAIKHGASAAGRSYLKLNFRITENHLYFNSLNSKPPAAKHPTGGIGLANIKRRLELLYPGNHTLELQDGVDTYTVNLIIPI
ncbi:MAG TPA: histidine kinase, partial [Agriterribacter sp.]|nr:histidine kinase [Agriterribacter sp.]